MIIEGGYTNYGETIGILMLDTKFPRPVGDIGNAMTFPFPVRYKKVKFAYPERIVKEADATLLEPFITGARELVEEGVKAITTSCGFLAMFQKDMAEAVEVPVFTSSLIQIPFMYKLMGEKGRVGILTASKKSLTNKHFDGVGIKDIPVAVAGMDGMPEFTRVFIKNQEKMDYEKCENEMVHTAQKLVREHPDVNIVVLECTNMPPFRKKIQQAIQKPVFDIVTLTQYIYMGVKVS